MSASLIAHPLPLACGDVRHVVFAGPCAQADAAWFSLRRHRGTVVAAKQIEVARRHGQSGRPLIVEPFSAADLAGIADGADGVLVGASWMQDFALLRAVARTRLPIILQRGDGATLEEWVSAAEYCKAEGNSELILCEVGSRTPWSVGSPDLTLMRAARAATCLPVLAAVPADLAVAAIAAGATGVLLDERLATDLVASVARDVAMLAPMLITANADTLVSVRAHIDVVDAALATLLERRAQLAVQAQRLKPAGYQAGRDLQREAELVVAMARRAPRLGEERLRRIMAVVIDEGIDLATAERGSQTVVD